MPICSRHLQIWELQSQLSHLESRSRRELVDLVHYEALAGCGWEGGEVREEGVPPNGQDVGLVPALVLVLALISFVVVASVNTEIAFQVFLRFSLSLFDMIRRVSCFYGNLHRFFFVLSLGHLASSGTRVLRSIG